MWELTAYELGEMIEAGKRRAADAARGYELLSFNIGALVLAAFNAPQRFPQTPDAAFGRRSVPADGGKADMMHIAGQINKRLADRNGYTADPRKKENNHDSR